MSGAQPARRSKGIGGQGLGRDPGAYDDESPNASRRNRPSPWLQPSGGPSMFATTLALLALAATSQADRCDPGDGEGSMICIDRNGACVEITIDGQKTTPFTDEAEAKRIHAIKHG